jgi:hypothetical protein
VHGWAGCYLAEGVARFGRSVASAEELPTPGGRCGEVAVPGCGASIHAGGWEAIRMEWLRKRGGRPDRAVDGAINRSSVSECLVRMNAYIVLALLQIGARTEELGRSPGIGWTWIGSRQPFKCGAPSVAIAG